jgi:hypothetical protein
VREQSDALTGLVKKINQRLDAVTAKTPRALGAFVIFVNNTGGLDAQLRELADKESLKRVSLCIGAAPKNYDLSDQADITVMIYTVGQRWEQSVSANFAFRKGELDEQKTEDMVKALSKVLPK